MTPEGKVKKLVVALFKKYDIQNAKDAGKFDSADGWYFCPGQNGFGVKGIPDYVGHYLGSFFAVETKAPGKEPEGFQALQIAALRASGAEVFVVSTQEELLTVEAWLEEQHQDHFLRSRA